MQRRMLAVAALASVTAAAGPIAAAQGATSRAKTTQAVIFGAITSQNFPVLVELSKNGRKVVRASIGLDLKCGVPDTSLTFPDGVENLTVSATGRFAAEQPVTRTAADPTKGTPAYDESAKLTGRVNKARTQIKGTWQRKIVIYDPADPTGTAVLDTCDTGVLRYTAKN